MSKILVPPELLFRVANEFHTASIQLEWTINLLNQQISTMLVWDGTTRQRFFDDFQRARSEMTLTIEHMKVISEELKKIANKFIFIDDKSNPLYMPRYSDFKPFVSGEENEPKTWQDYAEELWEGAKSGGKKLADSIGDTVESLIEDPLGTGGQMLYNATIGTVEEVIDTAVWGTKMVFDVGDTREKFNEKIDETGGMANYLGEQGALIAGGALLRRVGVKNRHDSGGDGGGSHKKPEGAVKDSKVGSIVKDGDKTIYTNPAGNELTWVDQHPKNINRDIDSALNSSNVGKATEAKVADFVRKESEVKGFGQKVLKDNGEAAGDLDVVTKDAIIEVKASIKAVKEEQFNKFTDVTQDYFFNPDNKKVILYIDKPLSNLRPEHKTMVENIKSKGVIIVNSLEDLKEVLK
ncbi:MAG: WXG100 family type VII secretion target [Bacillota bacterium]